MSLRQDRGAWEVRWRDGSGTRRAKRFSSEEAARAYDEALREVSPTDRRSDTARGGSGVYSYADPLNAVDLTGPPGYRS